MSEIHCFTSASFAYLDRVRVLGETLKRFHPDWHFSLCLTDEEPEGWDFDPAREPFDSMVRATELEIPNFRSWLFKHDIIELSTAVKGKMLCRLLEGGADKVVYLDPDIAVFASLEKVLEMLDTNDVVLTPHQITPEENDVAIRDSEIGSLKYGTYNLGFVAVSNRPEGLRFARWWRDRLLSYCYDDVPNGLFTDQKWCDLVPAYFDRVHVLRDAGYNVASWNLNQRPISIDGKGDIYAGESILRFFHFTKVRGVGEIMLERYARDRVALFELMYWYRAKLDEHVVKGLPHQWWAFSNYDSGNPIPKPHRIAYRNDSALQARFSNPYEIGENGFEAYITTDA